MKKQKLARLGTGIAVTIFWLIIFKPELSFQQSFEEEMNNAFKKAETINDYEQFIEKYKPNEMAFVAVQKLAKPSLEKKDWQGAAAIYNNYKTHFPGMATRFEKLIALLNSSEESVVVKNLGAGVNTDEGEYCPVISADNKTLYFIRSAEKYIELNNKKYKYSDEDVYTATHLKLSDREYWGNGYKMSSICTTSPEGPLGISSDGTMLILFGNYEGSLGRGDIFFTEKTPSGWSAVKPFPSPINSSYFDSDAMLSADGNVIFFVSDRLGGVGEFHKKDDFYNGDYWGNTDIYLCTKTNSGWSSPINLGEKINTADCERMPFLHPDGKTLYFSSNGHYGFGDLDVFKATRLNDTSWTEWSAPENLGKEYNSSDCDWGYKISTSGEYAYFSVHNRSDGYGKYDLYSIQLQQKAKPLAVTTISGKVADLDGKPLEVKIKWNDLTANKPAGEAKSDPQTGKYFIVLPAGLKYSYYADREGYIGKSEHIDLSDKKEFAEYNLDIVLYPLEQIKEKVAKEGSVVIPVNNIFFDVDQWVLKKESFLELDRWVDFLNTNLEFSFEIDGHTDNTGGDAYNQVLSEKRAQAVKDYLINRGIDEKRISVKGYGKTRPLATNETEEGRQKNRRVEIVFGKIATK